MNVMTLLNLFYFCEQNINSFISSLGLLVVAEVDLEVEEEREDHLVRVYSSLDGICPDCQNLRNIFIKSILSLQANQW